MCKFYIKKNRAAAIQCLIHLDDFMKPMIDYINFTSDIKKMKKIVQLFASILSLFETSYDNSVNIDDFYLYIAKEYKYDVGTQQDAQEFLRTFLDNLSAGLNRSIPLDKLNLKYNNSGFDAILKKHGSLQDMCKNFYLYTSSIEDSIVTDIFYGIQMTTFICMKCNYQIYTYQRFFDHPLILSKKHNNIFRH